MDAAWRDALIRKRRELEHTKVRARLDVADVDAFDAAVGEIARQYSSTRLTKFIRERLGPHIEHIKSFAASISNGTQGQMAAQLIWTGLLMVLEVFRCSCRFNHSLDQVWEQLKTLQSDLPRFNDYVSLYDANPGLFYSLRDLYEDYIDFCVAFVKWMSRTALTNLARSLLSSSFADKMHEVKSRISRHTKEFEDKAELAHRRKAELHYAETVATRLELTKSHSTILSTISPHSNATFTPAGSSKESSADSLIHTIIWQRNKSYFGRSDELEILHDHLNTFQKSSEPSSCAISGIGGVGKTQLALEYAYRYKAEYQAIFWLKTENAVELMKSCFLIGNKLGIIDDSNEGRRESRILEWLESTEKKWLLIMDNLERFETVSSMWPTTARNRGAIIVTTQRPGAVCTWADHTMDLLSLDPEAGSEMLLQQVRRNIGRDVTEERAKEIARDISINVGGLPLWIGHMGGFITQSQCTLSECLETYRSSSAFLDHNQETNWMYGRNPGAVFDLALENLSTDAKNLLYILAFLNPDAVPETMLTLDTPDNSLALLQPHGHHRFLSAIANLRKGQLVTRENLGGDCHLSTHRSLQMVTLHKLAGQPQQRATSFSTACALVRRVFPRPSPLQQPESEKWPQIEAYLPQLLSLEQAFRNSSPEIEGSLEFALLLSDVGLNVWDRGLSDSAKRLLGAAEKVLDSIGWDEFTIERSDIYVLLGILTDTIGISQRDEGLSYRKKAYEIRQRHIGPLDPDKISRDDDIRYHNTITDLACSLQQYNEYGQIEDICHKVLKKYQSWGTVAEYPYEYAKFYHHMAFVLVYRGDTQKAVNYATKAVEILSKGAFGLLATLFQFDCATIFFLDGQPTKAISEHLEVLNTRLSKLGTSNTMTLHSYALLGIIHYFDRNLTEAEIYLRKALRYFREGHWAYENLVRVKFYLSQVLKKKEADVEKSEYRVSVNEAKSDEKEHLRLLEEARAGLRSFSRLLPPRLSGQELDDNPLVYDYLVPWTYRVVVERDSASG